MTSYSKNDSFLFGDNASTKLMEQCKRLDRIQSIMTKTTHKKRQTLRKKLHRQIKKIKNQRNELHYKVINFLTLNYETIYLLNLKQNKW